MPGGSPPTDAPARAARLHGRREIRLEDAPVPVPGPGELLLRVTAVGLCGSDLHWYEEGSIGETGLAGPLVLGHELGATVVGGPRDGERVAIDPADPCERCELCRSGRGRLCPTLRFAGQAPTDGGLRTWMTWPASRCVAVPASIPDPAVPLLEVLGIALHAIALAEPRPGMTAGVYGSGPVGLVLVRALRAAGIERIVATDRLAHRVRAAAEAGATEALLVPAAGSGEPDPAAALPVDVAFDCAGDDDALATAIRAIRPGGRVLLVGIPPGDRSVVPASPARRKELTLQLVRRMEAPDLPRAVALAGSGEVDLAPIVGERFSLEEAPAAFERLARREGLKIVVEPGRRPVG